MVASDELRLCSLFLREFSALKCLIAEVGWQ